MNTPEETTVTILIELKLDVDYIDAVAALKGVEFEARTVFTQRGYLIGFMPLANLKLLSDFEFVTDYCVGSRI